MNHIALIETGMGLVFLSMFERSYQDLNLRKHKWLLFGSYHPPSQSDEYFFNHVKDRLDIYCKFYDKYMVVGDFNAEKSKYC